MPQDPVVVYAPRDSPRLRYVLQWLLTEGLGLSWQLEHDRGAAMQASRCISYGAAPAGSVSIPDAGLLWETGIAPQNISTGCWEDLPVFYATGTEGYTLPFDLFSAAFFLLSRYEEYGFFTRDRHGRYHAEESILYKNDVLERPVLDQWMQLLRMLLVQWDLKPARFSFLPSYDIDIAWSYLHKGLMRNAGGAARDLLRGKGPLRRFRVLQGREPDPYDAFGWLEERHRELKLKPAFFILAAAAASPFDKNISPAHPAMRSLIRDLGAAGAVGMHPSYYSDAVPQRMAAEKRALEEITGLPVTRSRQHYIKLSFPHTYRALILNGIDEDYSMGYSTRLGFRAGTGQSFPWYDLPREETTGLRIHPFPFMDTTAHYDLGLGVEEAFRRLREMRRLLMETGSVLTTVFHNFSLGTDTAWKGWREAYSAFLEEITAL